MIKELRDFLFQGNIVALAVAVVIAGAFGAVIASLVADIITPLLSALGLPDFSTWTITIGANGVLKPGRVPEHAHQLRVRGRRDLLLRGQADAGHRGAQQEGDATRRPDRESSC